MKEEWMLLRSSSAFDVSFCVVNINKYKDVVFWCGWGMISFITTGNQVWTSARTSNENS